MLRTFPQIIPAAFKSARFFGLLALASVSVAGALAAYPRPSGASDARGEGAANTPVRLDVVPADYVSSNSADTIFKGRLYWPQNDSAFEVDDIFSWEKFMADPANPKYGGRLPDYGTVSPIEVNDDINAIWNLTKHTKHVPGEKLELLSKRLQTPVGKFIYNKNIARTAKGLPELTTAHRMVLRAAANETFVCMNMYPGDAGLRSGPVTEPGPGSETSGRDVKECKWSLAAAQQILDLQEPKGSCGYHTSVLLALNHHAGIYSTEYIVLCRPLDYRGGYLMGREATNAGLSLHAIVVTYLPAVESARYESSNGKIGRKGKHSYITSDPTFYSTPPERREIILKSKVFPYPEHFLAGAKGDTVLTIRHSGSYMENLVKYDAISTRGFVNWKQGDFYKADVSSVQKLVLGGDRLREQVLQGKWYWPLVQRQAKLFSWFLWFMFTPVRTANKPSL